MEDLKYGRKGDAEVDVVREKANEAYLKGDFEGTIAQLTQLENQQAATPYDLFYLGVCNLRQDKTDSQKAIKSMSKNFTN